MMFKTALYSVLLILLAGHAQAERVRISDGLSPQQNYSLDLSWQTQELTQMIVAMLNGSAAGMPPLLGYLPGVEVRLDTSDYVGQRVRLYLVLPDAITADPSQGSLQLSWESTGDLLSGSVHTGQETLLFEGQLNDPVVTGVLNFMILVESDEIDEAFVIEPFYELEVLP